MSDIEMPTAVNPFSPSLCLYSESYDPTYEESIWDRAVKAQCKLLAEQGYVPKGEKDNYWWEQGAISQKQIMLEWGWRKLRTQYEIRDWLRQNFPILEEVFSIELLAQELHRWLLEGE